MRVTPAAPAEKGTACNAGCSVTEPGNGCVIFPGPMMRVSPVDRFAKPSGVLQLAVPARSEYATVIEPSLRHVWPAKFHCPADRARLASACQSVMTRNEWTFRVSSVNRTVSGSAGNRSRHAVSPVFSDVLITPYLEQWTLLRPSSFSHWKRHAATTADSAVPDSFGGRVVSCIDECG